MDTKPGCTLARVTRSGDPSEARRVAELFYESFGLKLAGLVLPRDRKRGVDLLARSFCLDAVYAALDSEDRVVGVAFVTGHERLLCLDCDALRAAYGSLGSSWRYAVYRVLSGRRSRLPRDTRGLEGFSVDPG